MRVGAVVGVLMSLIMAGCASATAQPEKTEEFVPTTREKVLGCLLQWDFMLYSFEAKSHGVDKGQFETYLLKQYTHDQPAVPQGQEIDPVVAPAIRAGVAEIYEADTEVPNFVYAMSDPLRDGFNTCMQQKGVTAFIPTVKRDLELAEFATIVAAARKTGISEAEIPEQYGQQAPMFEELITHVYDSPDFNAGSFRLALWNESVKNIE